MVIKAIRSWPKISEQRILSLVQEIHDMGSRLHSWQASHVHRDANSLVHHLARWAAAEFSSIGTPSSCEHSLDLSWLYAGTLTMSSFTYKKSLPQGKSCSSGAPGVAFKLSLILFLKIYAEKIH